MEMVKIESVEELKTLPKNSFGIREVPASEERERTLWLQVRVFAFHSKYSRKIIIKCDISISYFIILPLQKLIKIPHRPEFTTRYRDDCLINNSRDFQ